MKKLLPIIIILFLSQALLAQQLSKAYVLSEGGFSSGTSRLSMLEVPQNNFTESIFHPGDLGLYPDGMVYYEGFLYILEQGSFGGSGRIYKVDTTGLVINSEDVGTNPYSLAIANNKIYLTNGSASNVSVISLDDFSFIKNITVGVYPQEIIAVNNKIFVANNSLFGGAEDSTVSVIDASLDSVVSIIPVHKNPSSLAVSNDGLLFIGCPGDAGTIFIADPSTYQLIDTIAIPEFGFNNEIAVDKNSSDIYFISYINNIVKYNLVSEEISNVITSVFPNNYFYGYNFDYVSKQHYVLDAKDFFSSGSLGVYDNAGNIINTYSTSVAPRRVVFKYNDGPTGVENNPVTAKSYALAQNYPNPFNPSTTIQWSITVKAEVSLKIYDMLGKEVAQLVKEEKEAGTYTSNFDASLLSSGTYFYRLQAGSFIQTKKMTLVK